MALGRVRSWNDGDVLFAADQNAEFNNILNNPIALISPTTGPINFNGEAHTGLAPSALTASSGSTGQVVGVLPSGAVGFLNVGTAMSRVSGLVGTLSSQLGTFSADGYQMRSSSNLSWYVSATSAFSANINNDGPIAGGKDKTGAFAGTEIHWYAITTGPGSTSPAGLISTQAPPQGPILPAGYSGWAYLGGSPYTAASSTVTAAHSFRGNQAIYHAAPTVLSGGAAIVESAVSVSSAVPSNVVRYTLTETAQMTYNSGLDGVYTWQLRVLSGVTHVQRLFVALGFGVGHNYGTPAGSIVLPGSTGFFYLWNAVPAGSVSNNLTLTLNSYTMPNGDV